MAECRRCDYLYQTQDGVYRCDITFGKLDSIKEPPKWCPLKRNCHEYCRFAKMCRYAKGADGVKPEDCGTYYKLEDIEMEAREIAREQRRIMAEEGGIDESEVDDW